MQVVRKAGISGANPLKIDLLLKDDEATKAFAFESGCIKQEICCVAAYFCIVKWETAGISGANPFKIDLLLKYDEATKAFRIEVTDVFILSAT